MNNKIKHMYEKAGVLIREKKKVIFLSVSILCIAIILSLFTINFLTPTLRLEAPQEKIISNYKEEIIIPAVLSNLPDNSYPATSVSINFDNNKLEFVRLTIGTMESYNDYDTNRDATPSFKIPQWTYNAEIANEEGEIRAMYLDTTAGKNAYVKEGFEKSKKDIPFKLVFKLKESVIPGDKLEIDINEAVFATIDGDKDKTTLSTKGNYSKLKIKDSIIKIYN